MALRDLLFELLTEELPPRALPVLSNALADGLLKGLDAARIPHGPAQRFATPRRLAVRICDCAESAPDRQTERRGPPVAASFDAQGLPTQAATAFAKSCGIDVVQLERLTTDKGSWLAFRGSERGAATASLLAGIVATAIAGLPIAKRMRWGSRTAEFVRPVHRVILLFGEDIVPIEVLGLTSNRLTSGHRFHAPKTLSIKSPRSYEGQLQRAKVIADFDARRAQIREGVMQAAAAAGGTALIEESLLDEVTGLVEWPVPIAGRFEARFLELPREVVIATVQGHQRYFPIEAVDGHLSGGFVTVSNIESRDPATVREGNERVVRPRLSDAAFFWDQDRQQPLEELSRRLAGVTFQVKLGSYADKAIRVGALAEAIGQRISVLGDMRRIALLAKADLMSALVGEFPELQGTVGRYLAEAQGEPVELALAIEEQYRPRFAGDALPTTRTGQALAVAEKIDTLVGIFAIEQRPSGTKDPFGLRRAALGVLRILLECGLDLDLSDLLRQSAAAQPVQRPGVEREVYEFMMERLRGVLLERVADTTAEMVDAVLVLAPPSPKDTETRLKALKEFLQLPDAAILASINKRIVNILRKAPAAQSRAVRTQSLTEPSEQALHRVLATVGDQVKRAALERRYADALTALTGLRVAIDDFFEQLMVMDPDEGVRNNRLALLNEAQSLLGSVADLSRLPG